MRIVLLTTDNREPHKDYSNPQPHFGTAPAALLQGLAMLPELEVHVVSCIRRTVESPAKLGRNIFFHSLVVPKIGWMRTLFQGCIRAARTKIHEIHPDLVHGQGTEADCSLSAILSGYPNVLTLHGNMRAVARISRAKPLSYNWLAARLEGHVLPRTGGVVCITRYTQAAVAGLARKTWVVPNAVDASFFNVENAPSSGRRPVVLCVGTVCLWKNQNAFIQALDPVASRLDFQLVFLGGLPDGPYSVEFSNLLKTRPWCEHHGFADRTGLKDWLKTATALALPSLEDNCPMVILEAMASGVPVMASSIGGVPDLIEQNRTGLLCDPHEPESFAACMEKLLSSNELCARLARKSKSEAMRRFHPLMIAKKHLAVYHEALGNRV